MKRTKAHPSRAGKPSPQARRPRSASAPSGLPPKTTLKCQLQAGAQECVGANIPAEQIESLYAYCRLVAQWNRAYSLISSRTLLEIVPRHICDSLSLSDLLPTGAGRILDVGCGAGLPGLPLAITHPGHRFTLLDRSRKKTCFVRQAVLEINLSNVEVVTEEVERYRGSPFDCIMARAVGTLAKLVRNSSHLLAPHGTYLLQKSSEVEQELRELPAGWHATVTRPKSSSGHAVDHRVVALQRSDAVPERP